MGSLWIEKPRKKEKQAKLPQKPKYEPKQIIPKGNFKPIFKKASELKK